MNKNRETDFEEHSFPDNVPDISSQGDAGDFDGVLKQILETGSVSVRKKDKCFYCMTVIGQIEGHYISPQQNKTTKYEHVIPQLIAVEECDDIDGLLIVLNTVGGDIEAGLALSELIAGMKKPSVSLVLGGGHSIGIPLAVSADYSFIVPSATMTVHPVRMNGLVLGVPQTLDYFMKMQDRIANFVSSNSHIKKERFEELMHETGNLIMDLGTILDGRDAVKEGLIDDIGSLSNAFEKLYSLSENKEEMS